MWHILGMILTSLQVAHAAPTYPVLCADENDCPGFIAGLSNGAGVCSSFLVAEDIMATNLHCIPEDLAHDNQSCKDRITVFFPKTSQYEKESAECETILHVSPPLTENFLSPDFAFFKLSRSVQRKSVEISQSGITDMSEMTVYKVDPSETHTSGTIYKVQCTAVQNSLINPFFSSDKAPLISLMPCHTIKGNSGSPILGSDGKAHGILSAMSMGPLIVADPEIKAGMSKGVATLGSNFSCLNTFFLGRNQGDPEGCKIKVDEKTRNQLRQKITDKALSEAEKELTDKINAAIKVLVTETKSSVRWTIKHIDANAEDEKSNIVGSFELQPKCLIPPKGAPEVLRPRLRSEDILLPISWKRYRVHLDHDTYFRARTKIEEERISANFVFKPSDFLNPEEFPVRIEKAPTATETFPKDAAPVLSKAQIGTCKNK